MTSAAPKPLAGSRRMGVLFAGALLLAGCAITPADVQQWAATGGGDALPRLEAALASPNTATRDAAVAALIKLPDKVAAKQALMQAMLSPNPTVRGEVGAALVFNADADLDLGSISLVADPDPGVRRQMAEALAAAGRAGPMLNTNRAGIYLWGLTQDNDPEVRAAADEGVATLGLNDPIDFALTALVRDPEPRVRAAAARGLGVLAKIYLAGGRAPDVVQTRGEEIVQTLMASARLDSGQYSQVNLQQSWLFTYRVTETHWVATEAADALTVPNLVPRPDVAAAIAVGRAHGSQSPATPPHPPKFNLRGENL
jgi:hypothetical protein